MTTILAVAIGDPINSRQIDARDKLTGARPYVRGLVDHLTEQKNPLSNKDYLLGTDFMIDYKEFSEDE